MIVTLDIGNSRPNYCTFQNSQITAHEILATPLLLKPEDHYICSKVGRLDPDNYIRGGIELPFPKFHQQGDKNYFLDMPVHYSETLGQDRLATTYAYFGGSLKLNSRVALILDAGTFLTVDLVSKKDGFLGGYIFPGIDGYYQNYKAGAKLPHPDQLKTREADALPHNFEIPHDTLSAIEMSYFHALESLILRLVKKYGADVLILTGGSALQLMQKLTSADEALPAFHHASTLVHQGLLSISKKLLEVSQ
jgi:pantothenate kinase type III